jgi:hypothetical protein
MEQDLPALEVFNAVVKKCELAATTSMDEDHGQEVEKGDVEEGG